MFLLIFTTLQIVQGCFERVQNAEAGMILLKEEPCRYCNNFSHYVQQIKSSLPEGGIICSKESRVLPISFPRRPNYAVPNFLFFRKGELFQVTTENFTLHSISQTMNKLLNPPVHFIDDSNVSSPIFYQTEKTVIFYGEDEDFEQFYRASIHFRNYPITFLMGHGEYSAKLIDNYRKRTINYRGYPESIIDWVSKVSDITPPFPVYSSNSSLFLFATYGPSQPETEELFNKLSYLINENFILGYANWDRDRDFLQKCRVTPNKQGTYLAITPDGRCYPFVDDDVATPELISFFLSKVYNGQFDSPKKILNAESSIGRVLPLDSNLIRTKIPSNKCTVLHITNSFSFSHKYSTKIFAQIAPQFAQKNLAFYEIDTRFNSLPAYVPNNDGFPMVAMWKPNDEKPSIFRDIMTKGTLANWIFAVANLNCNITIM